MKSNLLIILIGLLNWSCYDVAKQLEKIDRSKYPYFMVPKDSIRANGVDTIQIRVVFPVPLDSNSARVNFTTSEGVFVANNKTDYSTSQIYVDRQTNTRYVYANLRASNRQGVYRVNIEIPKVIMGYVWVKFGPSYPTTIATDKDKFSVTKNYKDEIQLIANLTSSPGVPHSNTPVSFLVLANSTKYSSDDPQNSGNFRDKRGTDSNGRASVYFSPGDLGNFTGPVSYTASVRDASNLQKTAIGTFQITP